MLLEVVTEGSSHVPGEVRPLLIEGGGKQLEDGLTESSVDVGKAVLDCLGQRLLNGLGGRNVVVAQDGTKLGVQSLSQHGCHKIGCIVSSMTIDPIPYGTARMSTHRRPRSQVDRQNNPPRSRDPRWFSCHDGSDSYCHSLFTLLHTWKENSRQYEAEDPSERRKQEQSSPQQAPRQPIPLPTTETTIARKTLSLNEPFYTTICRVSLLLLLLLFAL